MSFAEVFRQQALPTFRHIYLRIADLETVSKEQLEKQRGRVQADSCVFESALQSELDRLVRFVASYSEELWVRLCTVLETLEQSARSVKKTKKHVAVREDGLDALESECEELSEVMIGLDEFLRQNVLAAALLAQTHDAELQTKKSKLPQSVEQISPVYLKAMEKCLIREGSLDPLVLGLSQAYSKIRKLRNCAVGEENVWEPPDMFQRNTTKYWIHPADVLRVKFLVMKHLPILIFGKAASEASAAAKLTPLKDQTQREHGLICSVYFDSEKLDTYHERLVREHGASLVRIRWYGKERIDADDKVFVERKVHKDGWTGEKSYKERAELPAREVEGFLSGAQVPTMNDENPKTALLRDMQERILKRCEVPSVRTEYRRVAFQESSSNRVRMSLDTNLRVIKELNAPKSGWCRSLMGELDDADVLHFPYAVFEIKVQGDEPPDWVKDLTDTGLLVEVPKFSKFLHGTAMLLGSKLRNSPGWFAPDEEGYMAPATLHEMADRGEPYTAGFLFPAEVSTREQAASVSCPLRPMQVSTLCHVPDHHTVLSEVVVMPSRQQNAASSRRVTHTSLHSFPSRLSAARQRPLSNTPLDLDGKLDIPGGKAGAQRRWRFPWGKRESVCVSPSGARAAALVRTRIEPKVFFANERTFLSWLTVAVMVMFMGLSLLDASTSTARSGLGLFGTGSHCPDSKRPPVRVTFNATEGASVLIEDQTDSEGLRCQAAKVSGALIAPMALILMVYALYMYRKRSIQILRRETVRYDDQRGPVILTVLLVTVLLVAYLLSVA